MKRKRTGTGTVPMTEKEKKRLSTWHFCWLLNKLNVAKNVEAGAKLWVQIRKKYDLH